jgi:hypothetical protein
MTHRFIHGVGTGIFYSGTGTPETCKRNNR